MDVNHCPVFVSSADSYSDLWPAFFALLKREWPSYEGRIYLNTQHLEYAHPGLDIVCTRTGEQKGFGETFLRGMEMIEGDHFLSLMIDFFLEGRVDVVTLGRLYNNFLNRDVDVLVLEDPPISDSEQVEGVPECHRMLYPVDNYGFGFSGAFRRKGMMRCLLAPWETPWLGEYYGSMRANLVKPEVWFVHGQNAAVLPFHPAGVLHGGGRWLREAVERIDWTGIPKPYENSQRAEYVEPRWPYLSRLPGELKNMRLHLKSLHSIWKLSRAVRRKRNVV